MMQFVVYVTTIKTRFQTTGHHHNDARLLRHEQLTSWKHSFVTSHLVNGARVDLSCGKQHPSDVNVPIRARADEGTRF